MKSDNKVPQYLIFESFVDLLLLRKMFSYYANKSLNFFKNYSRVPNFKKNDKRFIRTHFHSRGLLRPSVRQHGVFKGVSKI